jgi:hypothetical protein
MSHEPGTEHAGFVSMPLETGPIVFFEILPEFFKSPLIYRQERRQPMPFCKRENLAEISRKYGIPYPTLYGWVRIGRIVLPRDEELLSQLRRSKRGRYYRKDDQP